MRRLKRYWNLPFSFGVAALALGALALIMVVERYLKHLGSGLPFPFSWGLVTAQTASEVSGLLLVLSIIGFLVRPLIRPVKAKIKDWILLVSGLAILSVIHRIWSLVFFDVLYHFNSLGEISLLRPQNMSFFLPGMLSSLLQLTVLAFVIWGKSYYDHFIKQKHALAVAELKALKMQLHPHFLFNTFHSISAMIDIHPESAQLMLSRLSLLLRGLLEKDKQEEISLQEEIDFIRHYLGIEEVRFQDRLKVQYSVQPDTLRARIPTFILLPLVENSIKHGISQVNEKGLITVGAERIGNHTLKIWIEDNGPGLSTGKVGFGLGLDAIQQRLEQSYGGNFHFESFPLARQGYRSTMLIPFEQIKEPFHVYTHPNH